MMNIFSKEFITLYNNDIYHIEFLDKLNDLIPKNLLWLYNKVVDLSVEAPFNEELNESYQLSIELLCKSLGYSFDINGNIYYKEVN